MPELPNGFTEKDRRLMAAHRIAIVPDMTDWQYRRRTWLYHASKILLTGLEVTGNNFIVRSMFSDPYRGLPPEDYPETDKYE